MLALARIRDLKRTRLLPSRFLPKIAQVIWEYNKGRGRGLVEYIRVLEKCRSTRLWKGNHDYLDLWQGLKVYIRVQRHLIALTRTSIPADQVLSEGAVAGRGGMYRTVLSSTFGDGLRKRAAKNCGSAMFLGPAARSGPPSKVRMQESDEKGPKPLLYRWCRSRVGEVTAYSRVDGDKIVTFIYLRSSLAASTAAVFPERLGILKGRETKANASPQVCGCDSRPAWPDGLLCG